MMITIDDVHQAVLELTNEVGFEDDDPPMFLYQVVIDRISTDIETLHLILSGTQVHGRLNHRHSGYLMLTETEYNELKGIV
jgi:hypothetical protein